MTPLTDDTRTIANLMPALSPAIMPLPGANATSGIEMASELLRTAGAQGGQILLMTDGLPAFDTDMAQRAGRQRRVFVYSRNWHPVGRTGIPLPNGGFLKDGAGEIVIPALEASDMRAVADALDAPYREVTLDEADIVALTERDLLASEGNSIWTARQMPGKIRASGSRLWLRCCCCPPLGGALSPVLPCYYSRIHRHLRRRTGRIFG